MSDESVIASSGGMRGRHYALLVVAALIIVAAVFYASLRREETPVEPGVDTVAVVPEGTRAVTLFFADRKNIALVDETREVAIGREFTEEVKQIMKALLEGPRYEGVSAIPAGTAILDVFYDTESATLYLDFSSQLVAAHPGGTSAEYYTIAAIMRTVSENFPEVKAVQFLVEGLQMGTIGGHIELTKPFLVKDWR
jgi:spore germination protein GerM